MLKCVEYIRDFSHGYDVYNIQRQFSSVQSISHVRLFATPWTTARQSSLSVHHQLPELAQTHVHRVVMPSSHLILCRPLLLLPSIFPSIRVFSNASVLCIRWPKYLEKAIHLHWWAPVTDKEHSTNGYKNGCVRYIFKINESYVHQKASTRVVSYQFYL